MYIRVVFPGIDSFFTYQIDDTIELVLGVQVLVPFGKQEKIGYYCGKYNEKPSFTVKKPREIFHPAIPQNIYSLCTWVSDYYRAPLGSVLQSAYPPFMRIRVAQSYIKGSNFFKAPQEMYDGWKKDGYTREELIDRFSLNTDSIAQLCHDEVIQLEIKGIQKESSITEKRVKLCTPDTITDTLPARALVQRECITRLAALQGDAPVAEFQHEMPALRQLAKKGIVEFYSRTIATQRCETPIAEAQKNLTVEQQSVYDAMKSKKRDGFSVDYLFGITGSGKTHVYFQRMRDVIAEGKQAMYLVPEVALTHHLITRFTEVFGTSVRIMHSYMNDKERARSWHDIRNGKCSVILGTRSAVFAPAEKLGIIIVDEEHETSFKQDETPRYNGRDTAIMRAKLEHIPILLGSATPSVESYAHVQHGKYNGYVLQERYGNAALPECSIVDMRNSSFNRVETYPLSAPLITAMRETLARGEQIILFLNRKGFHTMLSCARCTAPLMCSKCALPLTYYKKTHAYKCHICGTMRAPEEVHCTECSHTVFTPAGTGTERLLEKVRELFPEAISMQIDTSIIKRHKALDEVMERFEQKDIDILIGTQMIAKGLDFESVTLVGIIHADGMLNIPDFRANERAYQLISQVAGRAGRGDKKGNVIIQTYVPDHYVIQAAVDHEYKAFYTREESFRKLCEYPPFVQLVRFRFEHEQLSILESDMKRVAHYAAKVHTAVKVIGPEEDMISKKNNKFQYTMLLKGKRSDLHTIIDYFYTTVFNTVKASVLIDVDPYSMF